MSDQDYYDDPELAAQEAAIAEQIARLVAARAEVQSQTRGLETDVGSFRTEQQLAADAAHTATVELAASQGGDFYSSDVGQQVAPDGTITYDFDAHLHARGVDFDAGTGLPAADLTRILWKRTSDGAAVAELVAYDNTAGVGELLTHAQTPDGSLQALVRHTINHAAGHAQVSAEAFNAGTDVIRTIIDDTGASSYLQFAAGPSARRVALGSSSVTVPAGVSSAALNGVQHGLGVIPAVVVLTPSTAFVGAYAGAGLTCPVGQRTTTAFNVHANTGSYTGGVVVTFDFIAIG